MLHVRFGDYDGNPREVHTIVFGTEPERRAFIDGMYTLWQQTGGEYQITEKLPDGSIPDREILFSLFFKEFSGIKQRVFGRIL